MNVKGELREKVSDINSKDKIIKDEVVKLSKSWFQVKDLEK